MAAIPQQLVHDLRFLRRERVCSDGSKRTSTSPGSWPLIARGRERVAGLAAKRTFTIPCLWPLNPQGRERVAVGGGQKNVHHPWPLALSTLSVRGRERVAGVAAKRTFTVPGPWPLSFHSRFSYFYYYSFHRWPSGLRRSTSSTEESAGPIARRSSRVLRAVLAAAALRPVRRGRCKHTWIDQPLWRTRWRRHKLTHSRRSILDPTF